MNKIIRGNYEIIIHATPHCKEAEIRAKHIETGLYRITPFEMISETPMSHQEVLEEVERCIQTSIDACEEYLRTHNIEEIKEEYRETPQQTN